MHKTIIDAVKTKIDAIGGGVPTVIARAHSWRPEGDAQPLIILTMGDERGTPGDPTGELREYEILVTLLYVQSMQMQTGFDDAKDWRDTIRKRLVPDPTVASGSILTGVSAVWNVDADNMPSEDQSMFEAGYEEAKLGLVFYTSEVSHA